jgi:N-acyl-D-amino-acid deacylase
VIQRKARYYNSSGEHFNFLVTQPEHTVGGFGGIIDDAVFQYMLDNDLPNASVGVLAGDGRLVYCRGFTNLTFFTNNGIPRSEGECAHPDSVYRIASLTKPITATAVFQLIERGAFSLDSYFMDLLSPLPGDLGALPNYVMVNHYDPSLPAELRFLTDVTIQDLLRHTSGWCDRSAGAGACPPIAMRTAPQGINITRDDRANEVLEATYPLSPSAGIYAAFFPDGLAKYNTTWYWGLSESGTRISGKSGSQFHYSNLGYRLLSFVIREISGKSWEHFLKDNIFSPLRMTRTQVGGTSLEDRVEHEVLYYPRELGQTKDSVLTPNRDKVELPYGGHYKVENMLGDGALISSVPDYLRFLNALRRNRQYNLLLSMASIRTMQDDWSKAYSSYSHGWFVDHNRPEYNGSIASSGGPGPGTIAKVRPVTHSGNIDGVRAGFYRIADESTSAPVWQNCAVVAFCNRTIVNEEASYLHKAIVDLITDRFISIAGITVPAQVTNWGSSSSPSDDLWTIFNY